DHGDVRRPRRRGRALRRAVPQSAASLYQGLAGRRARTRSELSPRLRQADGRQGLAALPLAGALHPQREGAAGPARCRRGTFRARGEEPGGSMRRVLLLLAALLFAGSAPIDAGADGQHFHEAPELQKLVMKGKLPTVEERLPQDPAIATFEWPEQVPGEYGDELDMLTASSKDARYMTQFSYARLVGFNSKFELVPDILKSYEVEGGRIFTFHLRNGQNGPAGSPSTTEASPHSGGDAAKNPDPPPPGPPIQMLVDGEPPKVEVIDPWTIRYSWSQPNAEFL